MSAFDGRRHVAAGEVSGPPFPSPPAVARPDLAPNRLVARYESSATRDVTQAICFTSPPVPPEGQPPARAVSAPTSRSVTRRGRRGASLPSTQEAGPDLGEHRRCLAPATRFRWTASCERRLYQAGTMRIMVWENFEMEVAEVWDLPVREWPVVSGPVRTGRLESRQPTELVDEKGVVPVPSVVVEYHSRTGQLNVVLVGVAKESVRPGQILRSRTRWPCYSTVRLPALTTGSRWAQPERSSRSTAPPMRSRSTTKPVG